MSKPLNAVHPLCHDTVELLEHLYKFGLNAHKNNDCELSALCAYAIFDIIDYGRRQKIFHEDVEHFKLLLSEAHTIKKSFTLNDIENLAAEKFLAHKN